jgi:hypothetical protein
MIRRLLALCAVASLTPLLLASADAQGNSPKFKLTQPLTFHQLTSDLTRGDEYRGGAPVISGDGNWIAFAGQTGSNQPYVIDEMKFDGTDRVQLDTWPFSGAPYAQVAIDDIGERVVSSDQYQLRTATPTSEKTLIQVGGQEITQIAISGNGSLVFFIVRRDTSTATGQPIQRGLWSIKSDGSCLTHLAGPDNVAAALTLQPSDIFPFDTDVGSTLGASDDGLRAVFSTIGAGKGYLLRWEGDACAAGSVHTEAGPPPDGPGFPKLWHAAISSSGARIAYDIGGSTRDISTVDFDGSADPVLIYSGDALLNDVDRLQLSVIDPDLPVLLAGSSGLLFSTNFPGTPPINLDAEPNSSSFTSSTYAVTMDDQAVHFVYLFKDAQGRYQIASIERGGPEGAEPTISDPSIVPSAFVKAGGLPVTLKVKITHKGTLNYVRYQVLVAGSNIDPNMSNGLLHKSPVPLYFKAPISANSGATPGSRRVRVEAQATVNGKLLATEVTITPFTVKA